MDCGVPHPTGYFGHLISGGVISAIPLIAQFDANELGGRVAMASCGGLAALLALIGDRPQNWQDASGRLVGGVVSCFLFGPWIAVRFGMAGDFNGLLLIFGVIGFLSWYVIGSVTHGLKALRDSGSLFRMLAAMVRVGVPEKTDKDKQGPAPAGGG